MTDLFFLIASGFTAGILASAHCVIMCGGISIFVAQQPYGLWPHVLRISIYCLLAVAAVYTLTPIIDVPRWWLGVGLIGAALMSWYSKSRACAACPSNSGPSNSAFKNPLVWLWGFLPCPMVFMMISTSIALDSAFEAALLMGCFGLGTLPSLLSVSYGSKWFVRRVSFHKKWLEFGLVGLGIWSLAVGLLPVHEMIHGEAHEQHQHEHH